MTDRNPPDDPPGGPPTGPPGDGSPLTPRRARSQLASELRLLRRAAGLTTEDAGRKIERSAATISRFESAKYVPRIVEINGLLDYYHTIVPERVTTEDRERILSLVPECRKEQWFDPFKDRKTGGILAAHLFRLVEYEMDASEIRAYESDLVPGLLQIKEYALAAAQVYFANREPVEHDRFAEFRVTRWKMLRQQAARTRLSFVVNEVALRRVLGAPEILRAQLQALVELVDDPPEGVIVRVLPSTVATPAALGASFVIFSFPDDDDGDLVYLESRTGGDYLAASEDIVRFNTYFENLLGAALSARDSVQLIRTIIDVLGGE